jgi:hypothetical protein
MHRYGSKEKTKLTLSLNKDVIQRAKAAGINISEITEKLLTAVTLTPYGNSYDDVIDVYGAFLDSIKVVLWTYGTEVKVKTINGFPENKEIILNQEGLWEEYFDTEEDSRVRVAIKDPLYVVSVLHDPIRLLENIINSLIEAALRNKQHITRLQFALAVVKALSKEEKGEGND